MAALNFKAQFAEAVSTGRKLQTIRAPRKHPIKPGDTIYLYTGMRTKACRKLGEGICQSVSRIAITEECIGNLEIGLNLAEDSCNSLARADGFRDWPEMREWFRETHGLPFEGVLIRWRLKTRPEGQPK